MLGAGFEHAPGLMAAIDRRWPVSGASPGTVAQLKDPFALAALLRRIGAPHPAVAADARPGWLSKRAGASGGGHIRFGGRAARGRYFQQPIAGDPVSALFLADGRRASLIGFSRQWTDPAANAPFRYGGAVGPVPVPSALRSAVDACLDGIVAQTGLRGLASLDLLVDGEAFVALEVNPRPGATLDVFDRGPASLFAAHLEASAGRLPAMPSAALAPQAAAVIYAPVDCAVAALARPSWTADWPADNDVIPRGAPACTAFAAAATPEAARALVAARRSRLLTSLGAGHSAARPTRTTVSA
ncbi:ATP-grasp domain-containing protein [Methylopila sp. 73B]|uniref:ATP-grasp domain-containing protein n=1 Tax=Methylopila sp. 73B TaxID=1120792 RepID=UPI001FDAA449|nr:ATP-grasp domain-containing protein [Methylopila sp. 73B]